VDIGFHVMRVVGNSTRKSDSLEDCILNWIFLQTIITRVLVGCSFSHLYIIVVGSSTNITPPPPNKKRFCEVLEINVELLNTIIHIEVGEVTYTTM
jgi:hypothetical protein